MSCHNVGHALNNVAKEILKYYKEGKLDFETTKSLLYTCRKSINYCDGNSYEALECLEVQNRCGCCLEVKDSDDLLHCYELPDDYSNLSEFLEKKAYSKDILLGHVCKDCAEKLVKRSETN